MRIKSKIDGWIAVVVWLCVLMSFGSALFVPPPARVGIAITTVPVALLLLWIYFGTWYELKEQHLVCRSGPFRERIAYDDIRSLRLCRGAWSSLALSTERIEIRRHNKGFFAGTTYISPENREEFYEELLMRCSNLQDSPSSDKT